MANREMVQIRITKPGKHFIAEGYVRQNQVLWVARDKATNGKGNGYIDTGLAEPAAAGVGPTEHKPEGPDEKKDPAGDEPAFPSIDSLKSPEPGMVEPSSASEEGPASQPDNAPTSRKKGRPKKSE